jgi:ubiquinone/menaquinone biosynthesis C-methylase UbiE
MKQSIAFLKSEADRYYRRNADKPRLPDRVLALLKRENVRPHTVLEVGCGDGWRLKEIRRELGAVCYGIDPSKSAIADAPQDTARYGIKCWRGTAEALKGVKDHSIDLLIYGFCLYLVDREDLFKVACEGDRVLRDGGFLAIHDFYSDRAYSKEYKHAKGILSYKQDYSKLWLGNPAYRAVSRIIVGTEGEQPTGRDDQVTVLLLRKDIAGAWPLLLDGKKKINNNEEPLNILAAG